MKDKNQILNEIFENDPQGLLDVKPKKSAERTSDERLAASFDEINEFFEKNNREPKPDPTNMFEYTLYSTLKGLRENDEKINTLEPQDKFGLLRIEKKEINSIADIFGDDSFDILGDDTEGLFDFKHTPKDLERASSDFVARRKKCKDFDKFENLFTEVQNELSSGERQLVRCKEKHMAPGNYFVHNGILMLLLELSTDKTEKIYRDGKRVLTDGRTRCIFENGTESNLKFQSIARALRANGKAVTQNKEQVNVELIQDLSEISDEDKETGYIYVLKSKSPREEISSIDNLYKIGYSSTSVQERIKNAENEPTYLMASVEIESSWMCYNLNAQKFEHLIHRFFGHICLEVDVFDNSGIRHVPREWFIVPLNCIEQAISLIISGEIVDYRYDKAHESIIKK